MQQQKTFKFTAWGYIGVVFFFLMMLSIFFSDSVFSFLISVTGGDEIQQSQNATKQTTDLLLSLDKITLNTSVLESSYLQALTPLPTFPIDAQTVSNFGKANPFVGDFIIVPTKASSTVGAVVYSNQRAANNNQSLRAVSPTLRR